MTKKGKNISFSYDDLSLQRLWLLFECRFLFFFVDSKKEIFAVLEFYIYLGMFRK